MTQTTQVEHSANASVLYMAMELSKRTWKLGFSVGGHKLRRIDVPGGDLDGLKRAIKLSKRHFKLDGNCVVKSCYEAGRDGFWIHRALTVCEVENVVVDAASIEVNRRKRRAKTDRLDLERMVKKLVTFHREDKEIWRTVAIPSPTDEDDRRLHRELQSLTKERTRHRNAIQSAPVTVGVIKRPGKGFGDWLDDACQWDEQKLSPNLSQQLRRQWNRLELVENQQREIRREIHARIKVAADAYAQQQEQAALGAESKPEPQAPAVVTEGCCSTGVQQPVEGSEGVVVACRDSDLKVVKMMQLRAIGELGAWVLNKELFGWRCFCNRRQVGAIAGLTPSPYDSGDSGWDQGISKSGNPRVRTLLTQLAWGWIRYQPDSAITQWYLKNFANGTKRIRRVGIIAVCRRLLIALWRYVEQDIVPQGALLRSA